MLVLRPQLRSLSPQLGRYLIGLVTRPERRFVEVLLLVVGQISLRLLVGFLLLGLWLWLRLSRDTLPLPRLRR